MLTRIAQNSEVDLKATFYDEDGAPIDAATTPTIEILREDGTVLVAAGTATTKVSGETGIYSYSLTPTDTATLDVLTAKWSADLGSGTEQIFETAHAIIGSHFFTIAELRELEPLDDTAKYPTDEVAEYRDLASFAIENAASVAFVPSYGREILLGTGSSNLALDNTKIRSLTSVEIDGTALTAAELADVIVQGGGLLYRSGSVWPENCEVEVKYVHGYGACPNRIARATMLLATHWAFGDLDSGLPERATSLSTEAGTFDMVTAGVGRAIFDLPEVNAAVSQYQTAGAEIR